MMNGLIKGLKSIKSPELGKEIGLAIVAGVFSYLATEALIYYKNKNKKEN